MLPSLAPWLTIADGHRAVAFYVAAFSAQEVYRLEMPDGSLIVRLSVGAGEFWISGGPAGDLADAGSPVGVSGESGSGPDERSAAEGNSMPVGGPPLGGGSLRMILTVNDPDSVFAQALAAGAQEVFPVGEGHGWRLGRLVDPFGLHWEVGRML
jgi:PhnB protein